MPTTPTCSRSPRRSPRGQDATWTSNSACGQPTATASGSGPAPKIDPQRRRRAPPHRHRRRRYRAAAPGAAQSTRRTCACANAVETISEALSCGTADGRLVLCNSKYQAALRPARHVRPPGAAVRGRPREGLGPPVVSLRQDQPDRRRRRACHLRGAARRRTLAAGFPAPDQDGGFVSVGTDITELKRHEEQVCWIPSAADGDGCMTSPVRRVTRRSARQLSHVKATLHRREGATPRPPTAPSPSSSPT